MNLSEPLNEADLADFFKTYFHNIASAAPLKIKLSDPNEIR
jgi:hypothetical protein